MPQNVIDRVRKEANNRSFLLKKDEKRSTLTKPTRLSIVHIIKHCNYANGSVHVAVDLACEQAKAGAIVKFVSSGGTFEPLLAQHGVEHVCLPHEQGRPASVLRSAWKLNSLVREVKPTVLHAHMMSSALIGYAVSRLNGVPLVTTVHNSFDRHSFIMRLGDRVVAVSDAEREQLLKKGYKNNQVIAVMNAPNHSPREKFIIPQDSVSLISPCILAANGLHGRKGVSDVIVACQKLFAEVPEWKLYIAGEGPDREILERQVQDAGLADRVHFLGFRHAPRPLMEQADIFVLASYADPCSLAIGEARSAGCAVVATAVGGTSQMLEYGAAGRLVTPGHPEQLACEMKKLMLDDAARKDLQEAALSGSEVFDVARLVREYDVVYRSAATSVRDGADHHKTAPDELQMQA